MALLPLAIMTEGCDERRIDKAVIGHVDGAIAFDGDREACLRAASVRSTAFRNSQEDFDDGYVWEIQAPEGDGASGCMRFPLVYGETPKGADVGTGPQSFAYNQEYEFEAVSDSARYKRLFKPNTGNGIFYVEDHAGTMTDIRRARQ